MLVVQALAWLSLLLTTTFASSRFECLPYPDPSVCMIEYLYYHPDGKPVAFPTGYQHFRIIRSRSKKLTDSNVAVFDEALYDAMHRPNTVEMTHSHMEHLILPPELLLGNFAENSISSVKIHTGQNYRTSYLDLKSNDLTDMEFVISLVNLEMLHLETNKISTIQGPTLAPLTKLKYLYLQYNSFTSIPWSDLPPTLIHLDCSYCDIHSADFTNVSLPSLEYLSVEHNNLKTINVTALLRAAPRLRQAQLFNYDITARELKQINATLTANNISFIDSFWYSTACFFDEVEAEDGSCIPRSEIPVGTGKGILLSGVVIGAAALFVYIVMLVLRHMNR